MVHRSNGRWSRHKRSSQRLPQHETKLGIDQVGNAKNQTEIRRSNKEVEEEATRHVRIAKKAAL